MIYEDIFATCALSIEDYESGYGCSEDERFQQSALSKKFQEIVSIAGIPELYGVATDSEREILDTLVTRLAVAKLICVIVP